MLHEWALHRLNTIENSQGEIEISEVLNRLREFGLTEFSMILTMLPDARFPRISSALPAMAAEDIQLMWTGTSGVSLLGQTLSFVNCVAANYTQITGRRLQQAKILDFGCGYGRIMRPMYFYTDPENMAGIDPWDRSIEICQNDRMMGHLAVSDYLPKSLPVEMADFDLIYSFSVFTHLSERAARTCLKTLRSYIASDGVLVITIRPVEYWHLIAPTVGDLTLNTEEHPDALCHRLNGFAFRPHNRAPIDGDITYGDTSMTLEWLASAATGWEITSVDHSLNDALQLYVFLKPT